VRRQVNASSSRRYASAKGADFAPTKGADFALIPLERIRNFCIVAHVDHGKSTLADRILEQAGALRGGQTQVLDTLKVERDRGITVKAQTASILHTVEGEQYLLNLIDTPGHVDFSYEVSRSLAACQGCILLVDANRGVQAQTVANFYLAFGAELAVVPALNKVDLPGADPDMVREQLMSAFDIDPDTVLEVSAKLGRGVGALLDAVVARVPPPTHCQRGEPFRALLYDSWFHTVRGAVCMVAVVDGSVAVGSSITCASTSKTYTVREVGVYTPGPEPVPRLEAGQVGYLMANIKSTKEAAVGDTFKDAKHKELPQLPGFKPSKPMVYAGVYPIVGSDSPSLNKAIAKLLLNDSSVHASKEASGALGQGWRIGFLGLLHLDVFLQRLQHEHGAPTVTTAPSVPYQVVLKGAKNIKEYGSEVIIVTNPLKWPDIQKIREAKEPFVSATIITPVDRFGPIASLCADRRGYQHSVRQLDAQRLMLHYTLPLSEVVIDFYDQLKNLSSGYATFEYDEQGYKTSPLVKVDFLANGSPVEELCCIQHESRAKDHAKHVVTKMRDSIPRHMYKIILQGVIGKKIIAREDIKAERKNVTAKCYGGDITRKMKLLKNQADGKDRMRQIGNVSIPRQAFIDVLKK